MANTKLQTYRSLKFLCIRLAKVRPKFELLDVFRFLKALFTITASVPATKLVFIKISLTGTTSFTQFTGMIALRFTYFAHL